MTDPVIIRDCETCQRRTPHSRNQWGEPEPPRVITEHSCSNCGHTTRTVQQVFEVERNGSIH